MGNLIVSDNAATTLAGSITNSPSVSSISLIDASKFPVVNHGGTGDDWSYVTLFDSSNNLEIVKVVRRDNGSNNLSILRGTAAGVLGVTDANCRTWASGATGVACRLVAQVVNDISSAALTASAAATSAAASAAIVELPSTTRMPFAQATAPTGWTQDTTDAATNRMLRVVNTAGGGVGGSSSPIINDVVPSHTHSATASATNIDHLHGAWTDSQGSHQHLIYNSARYNTGVDNVLDVKSESASAADGVVENRWTEISGAHGHNIGMNGMNQNASHSHTITVNSNSGANWTPRYLDLILCTKD